MLIVNIEQFEQEKSSYVSFMYFEYQFYEKNAED